MAKKVEKKNVLFSLIGAVLGAVAILFCLMPFITYRPTGFGGFKFDFSGFQLMFGGKSDLIVVGGSASAATGQVETKSIALLVVAFILLVVGIALPVVSVFIKLPLEKCILCTAALCLIVAGIFLFMAKAQFVQINKDATTLASYIGEVKLGAGGILAGILSIVGGLVGLAGIIVPMIRK